MNEQKSIVINYIVGKIENHESAFMNNIINVMTNGSVPYTPIPRIPISEDNHIWFDITARGNDVKVYIDSDDEHLLEDDDTNYLTILPTVKLMDAVRLYVEKYLERMSSRVVLDIAYFIKR